MSTPADPDQLGLGERLASHLADLNPSPAQRTAAMVASFAMAVVIGVLDYYTGISYSVAVLYPFAVVLAALVVSAGAGCLISLYIAVQRIYTDYLIRGINDPWPVLWNAAGRFLSMAVVAVLLGTLRQTVVRLSRSERGMREFLATAAHQLRTPIAGLITTAEALSSEPDEDVQARLLENLVAGTNRTRRLLTSLLEMGRLDQGDVGDHGPADLASICRDEVDSFVPGSHPVEVRYDGPATYVVDTSGDAIREALTNLVDNAVRHARSEVTVTLTGDRDATSITVHDDGPGLPEGAETRVFERFVSLDGAGGAGLGLPIALASVRSVGGTVGYDGADFVVRLPATV